MLSKNRERLLKQAKNRYHEEGGKEQVENRYHHEALCEKCTNKEFFLVRIRKNTDQKKLRIWTLSRSEGGKEQAKIYYENNKERLQEQVRNKYSELSNKGKI